MDPMAGGPVVLCALSDERHVAVRHVEGVQVALRATWRSGSGRWCVANRTDHEAQSWSEWLCWASVELECRASHLLIRSHIAAWVATWQEITFLLFSIKSVLSFVFFFVFFFLSLFGLCMVTKNWHKRAL